MRAIPNLTVIRPADANEAAEAWARDPRGAHGARSASCSRARTCRSLDRTRARAGRRACAAAPTCSPTPTRPTWCSSPPAPRSRPRSAARDLLAEKGVAGARRLDAELGALRGAGRRLPRRGAAGGRAEDLGRGRRRRSAGRAGSTPRSAIDRFGASGKGDKVLAHFGISPEAVADARRGDDRRAAPVS